MKNLLIIFISILIGLIFMSCDDNNNIEDEPIGTMTYYVDGVLHNAMDLTAIVTNTSMKITGTTMNKQTVVLYLNDSIIGDYELDENYGNYAEYLPNSSNTNLYSTLFNDVSNGKIRIKGIDSNKKIISGDFDFDATRSTFKSARKITQGSFSNVKFVYLPKLYYFNYFYNNKLYEIDYPVASREEDFIIIEAISNAIPLEIKIKIHNDYLFPGTYALSLANDTTVSARAIVGFDEFMAASGKVVITNRNYENNILEGTFSFYFVNNNSETERVFAGKFRSHLY